MTSICCRHCLVLAWTGFDHNSRGLQARVSVSFRWSCLSGGKNKYKSVFMIILFCTASVYFCGWMSLILIFIEDAVLCHVPGLNDWEFIVLALSVSRSTNFDLVVNFDLYMIQHWYLVYIFLRATASGWHQSWPPCELCCEHVTLDDPTNYVMFHKHMLYFNSFTTKQFEMFFPQILKFVCVSLACDLDTLECWSPCLSWVVLCRNIDLEPENWI